jgi:hypothetical protein
MLDKAKSKIAKIGPTFIPYSDAGSTKIARVIITVDGIKPLLTHNPESMGVEVAPGKGSRIPEAEAEAEAGVYRDVDGNCCLKGEAFRGSLLGAAPAWRSKGKKTMKSLLSHVVVVEELVQLKRSDGSLITDYAIDARRAIIQRQGIIRRRPRFDEWTCTFTVEYDPAMIPDPKLIVDIMQDAGNRIGVGDFRPARNGFFGRFRVREFAPI